MSSPGRARPNHFRPPLRRSRRLLRGVGVVVLLLVALRLALPAILEEAINRRLNNIPDYAGQVDGVNLSLFRGAYTMKGLKIEKRAGATTHPFIAVEQLDFSVAWKELRRGRVVSEIVALRPRINVVQGARKETSQTDFDRRWQDVIRDLFPIDITHLEVVEGAVHFVSPGKDPPVNIFLRDLRVRARGLRNYQEPGLATYPAVVLVDGRTPGDGTISINCELEPLAVPPRFHARVKIDRLSLPAVNQFLLAYLDVDVSAGDFTGYLEIVARGGGFAGYLKPFFENLQFAGPKDRERPVLERLKEKVIAVAARVMKNDETEQVAMRIPFSGEFGATSVNRWESFRTLLRNAFVQALSEGLDSNPRPKGDPEPAPVRTAPPPQRAGGEKKRRGRWPRLGGKGPNGPGVRPGRFRPRAGAGSARASRCGRTCRAACRCARRCARRNSRAGPGAGSPGGGPSGSRRSRRGPS